MPEQRIDDKPSCGGGIMTRQIAADAKDIALKNRQLIDKIMNRPSPLITFVISCLSFALGSCVTLLITLLKLKIA